MLQDLDLLRQDPNIILVGEIRDQETADLAIQASLTGHLVFATLHTNDAPGALPRLLDMGAEPFLLASSLLQLSPSVLSGKFMKLVSSVMLLNQKALEEMRTVLGSLWPKDKEEISFIKVQETKSATTAVTGVGLVFSRFCLFPKNCQNHFGARNVIANRKTGKRRRYGYNETGRLFEGNGRCNNLGRSSEGCSGVRKK